MTKKQNEKKKPSHQKYVAYNFSWLLWTIVKRKFLTKENFDFVEKHKSYAFVKFLPQNILFPHIPNVRCVGRGKRGFGELFLGEAYVNFEVHGRQHHILMRAE